MILRLLPWKFLLQRAAHHYGFMDPVSFMARMRRFAQPSEVQEPIELLRAGVSFHARGLLNTKAIQTNLDWVWPYWVQRQFNPNDYSFIPRAFSFSHVNLTHRNWTAVGHPQLPLYPIVDPKGLITPLFDGWSIDLWLIRPDGKHLIPAQNGDIDQQLLLDPNLAIKTVAQSDNLKLDHTVSLDIIHESPTLNISITAMGPKDTQLVVGLRPYNPEGIQFIEEIEFDAVQNQFLVNEKTPIHLTPAPSHVCFSEYQHGDVIHHLDEEGQNKKVQCSIGMCTGAAIYVLTEDSHDNLYNLSIPLADELARESTHKAKASVTWPEFIHKTCQLTIPDKRLEFLYNAAVHTLILLSAEQIVPGPYTYFRFWFRDACLMINALLAANLTDRAESLLSEFPEHQTITGYFRSQEGEWDSNGQVLWIFNRFEEVTGKSLGPEIQKAARKAALWLKRKRLSDKKGTLHDGLLPPGFSAEHFGPNDYYYWDDFWAVGGLRGASQIFTRAGDMRSALEMKEIAYEFESSINKSLEQIPFKRSQGGLPASPYRRMDSGAIGSLVADYPLQLLAANDVRVRSTVDFLLDNCFCSGGFFQDMIHSGINAYLTLDIAQTLLRHNDVRYRALMKSVAELASPTGQWPEAIHPITKGGCMGDGQHGWAAAEWIMMIRNCFVREEKNSVLIGSGIFPEWLQTDESIEFGPTPTQYGAISIEIHGPQHHKTISVTGIESKAPSLIVCVPGFENIELDRSVHQLPLKPVE